LLLKKPALGLFHNSSAESEAPGTEINRLVLLPNQNEKTEDKLAFFEFVLSLVGHFVSGLIISYF
jgi:hypothetical protein